MTTPESAPAGATAPGDAAPYPIGLRLAGRHVVVVGGGEVAARRLASLVAADARPTVVAPTVSPLVRHLVERGSVRWLERRYAAGDVTGAWLVHACTDDAEVNAAVAQQCDQARIWCIRADDAAASAAWTPAVGYAGPLAVAVHAGGDPKRAAAARDAAVTALQAAAPAASRPSPHRGTVTLVGGGPGDPGLLTLRGQARLAEADVIVTDRLVPLTALSDLAQLRPDVVLVDAAKIPGGPSMAQERICSLLVQYARAGRYVVRLKGGDPYVFGRGMEEVQACAAAGVPVEVVPGVTSAVAVPALAGVPVTHRGAAQSFTVVSGHVPPGDRRSTVDWAALARAGGTIVVLMGVAHLEVIADTLLAAGAAPGTPVACVQDGATSAQRSVVTVLADAAKTVRDAGIRSPAVLVIGEVAAFAGTSAPT